MIFFHVYVTWFTYLNAQYLLKTLSKLVNKIDIEETLWKADIWGASQSSAREKNFCEQILSTNISVRQ